MICILCKNETEVTNSRAKARTPSVWRRRMCKVCVAQFSTIELPVYEKALSVVGQNDKTHYPFNRDKLFLSLFKSLGHRQDALNSSTALTSTVISRLLRKKSTPSQNPHFQGGSLENQKHYVVFVGDLARTSYEVLKRFDPLAASSYKAYHQAALKRSN